MKEEIIQRVIEKIDLTEEVSDDVVRAKIRQVVLEETRDSYLSLNKKEQICNEIFYSLRGLDILQDMLEDDSVTEIMINGYDKIFIEREGRLYRTKEKFSSKKKLEQVIQRIVAKTNRIVNESSPIVDARLSDGSRVHVVLEPISLDGSIMTIRKFSKEITSLEQLLYYGSLNKELMEFLSIMVRAHMNIFISGGTGAGKTTLLNALSNCIPADERIITIEDSAELRLNGIENLVRLEMRNANAAGEHQVDMKDLIKAALRSRPDRIIVGEVRGEEALSMLNAMNTGHDGSISTGHANGTSDMLRRIETMVLMGVDMPIAAIRGQMASAIDMILHLGRMPDGSRKLMEIVEVTGIRRQEVKVSPIFAMNSDGKLERTGEIKDIRKLKEYGQYERYQKLMEEVFQGTEPLET